MTDNGRLLGATSKKPNSILGAKALNGFKTRVDTKPAGYKTGFFESGLIHFTQILVRIIARTMLPLMARVEVRAQELAESELRPVIFVSNHKSYFDSMLIAYSFPFFSRIFPLRFIAWDKFFENFFSRMLFRSMGSYPSFYGKGIDKSLEIPDAILGEGGNVVFFIEGSCFRDDQLHPPKPGAAILALAHPEARIMPFAIRDSYKIKKFFRRPKVYTAIGKPFYLKEKMDIASATPAQAADIMMQEITKLYNNLGKE